LTGPTNDFNFGAQSHGPDPCCVRFADRIAPAPRNTRPKHASWLNQIEIWFSILQRRIIRHGSFTDTQDLRDKILRFIEHYNRQEAKPFRWTFRGKFRQHRLQVHRSKTVRRPCQPAEQKTTRPKLSKNNFTNTVFDILASAAAAPS
jgi:hypothetical protein